jgi:hypothetical protein
LTHSQTNNLSLSPKPMLCHVAASAASLNDVIISQTEVEAECIFRALTTFFDTRERNKPTAEGRNRDDRMQSSLKRRLASGWMQLLISGPCWTQKLHKLRKPCTKQPVRRRRRVVRPPTSNLNRGHRVLHVDFHLRRHSSVRQQFGNLQT